MPVKTITAEINGQTRTIKADIPDGASQDDIIGAVQDYMSARHGASGSWGGFSEGFKDAITAPFNKESWKSLTDNPLVNPLRNQMESTDLLTPENTEALNASNADLQNRIHLIKNGNLPFTPYEAGQGTASTIMAGSPEAFKAAWDAIPARQSLNLAPGDIRGPGFAARAKAAATAAAPDVGGGAAKVAGASALGYAASQLPIPGGALTGLEIGPGIMALRGGRQILSGLKNGVEEFRGPVNGPEIAPKGYAATPYDPSRDILLDEARQAGERLAKMKADAAANAPKTQPKGAGSRKLASPKTPVPATETPIAQSGPVIPAQSAAELLKTAGIGIDAVEKATPEQWNLIEKRVGSSVDQKATLEQMRSMETPAEYRQRIARTHAKFNAAGQRQ